MNSLKAFSAIISRNTVPINFKKGGSDDAPVYGSTQATFEVTKEEYQALNIQDRFHFHGIAAIVAQKSDSSNWNSQTLGYDLQFKVTFSFLLAI